MTDDVQVRKQAVTEITKGVAKKTAFIVSAAAVGSLIFALLRGADQRWWFLPVSVLSGGILGLLNFRWLATAVERVYLRQGATPGLSNLAAVIISVLKLSLIFIVLFVVIKMQLLHIFGLIAGLSLCFLAIILEGAMIMKRNVTNNQQ